mgnify:CR=1 FL=1
MTSLLEKSLGEFPESLEARVNLLADVSVSEIGQRYKMQQVLGSGAQATVYQAVAKKTQRKAAVKVLDQTELNDDDLFDALRMEIMILKQLKHPCACPPHRRARTQPARTGVLAPAFASPSAPFPPRARLLAPLIFRGDFPATYATDAYQIHCEPHRDRARYGQNLHCAGVSGWW